MKREVMQALHDTHEALGNDPRRTYVALMTAAAVSGHMIERTREDMHKTLDDVADAALAMMLSVTETEQ